MPGTERCALYKVEEYPNRTTPVRLQDLKSRHTSPLYTLLHDRRLA